MSSPTTTMARPTPTAGPNGGTGKAVGGERCRMPEKRTGDGDKVHPKLTATQVKGGVGQAACGRVVGRGKQGRNVCRPRPRIDVSTAATRRRSSRTRTGRAVGTAGPPFDAPRLPARGNAPASSAVSNLSGGGERRDDDDHGETPAPEEHVAHPAGWTGGGGGRTGLFSDAPPRRGTGRTPPRP